LVVVGGGISGLAAAWFYRRAVGQQARILVLDNHDDFGGHAKRNELAVGLSTFIGYGGSQSIQSPKTLWSDVAKGLLRDLGVDLARFDTAFQRDFYPSLGLSRGMFFDRDTFGADKLLAGDALMSRGTDKRPELAQFVAVIPIADQSKKQLLSLYDPRRDPLAGKSAEEKLKILKTTSYRDYLVKICGCSEEVANCFQGRPLGFFGLGCDGHAILACFHMMIPYLMPELPQWQREALAKNVKTPLVYTNVLMRNWQPWLALKVSDIVAPTCFFNHVALDFPVDLGGYSHPRDPTEPIVVHLVHVPGAPNSGLDARAQFHVGQAKLLAMTFADFEARIRDQLDRMLGPGGFASERDISAITVNRWPHGYGYAANSLFDPDDYEDRVLKVARQPFGRVAIANSDAGGDAYAHLAIDAAARATQELL
jgi:hypothetical protein